MDPRLAVEVSHLNAFTLSSTPFEDDVEYPPESYIDFVIPYNVDRFMRAAIKAALVSHRGVFVKDGDPPPYAQERTTPWMSTILFLALFAVLDYIFQRAYARVFIALFCYFAVWYFKEDLTAKVTCELIAMKMICEGVKKAFALVFGNVAMQHMIDETWGVAFHQPYVVSRTVCLSILLLFCIYKMLH